MLLEGEGERERKLTAEIAPKTLGAERGYCALLRILGENALRPSQNVGPYLRAIRVSFFVASNQKRPKFLPAEGRWLLRLTLPSFQRVGHGVGESIKIPPSSVSLAAISKKDINSRRIADVQGHFEKGHLWRRKRELKAYKKTTASCDHSA